MAFCARLYPPIAFSGAAIGLTGKALLTILPGVHENVAGIYALRVIALVTYAETLAIDVVV